MFGRIREDIQSVFHRDPAARNSFEVFTCYPGLHAILFHRLSYRLWCWKFKWLARFISGLGRWFTGIEIHPGATIGRRFFIDHGMGVVVGETAEIGDDVTIYHGVTLGGTSWKKGKRHPTLKNGVVIGAGAKVLGPITIAEGARVGSNAVVTKDVPEGATAVGIPARIINKNEGQQKRQDMERKIGFDAYGVAQNAPDPVARSIHGMLNHMHKLDRQVEELTKALNILDNEKCNAGFTEIKDDICEGIEEPKD